MKTLYTDVPPVPNYAHVLSNFTELINLGIETGKVSIVVITNETFQPLMALPIRHLTIHSKRLSKIEAMAFSWFPHLESLDLSNSNGMNVNMLSDAWIGMNSNLRSLKLVNFRAKPPSPINLTESFFKNFLFENLTMLILEDTDIEGTDADWILFKRMKNLSHFSLSNNNLMYSQLFKLSKAVEHFNHLTYLDLSNQSSKHFQPRSPINFQINLPPNLQKLDMSKILFLPSFGHAIIALISFSRIGTTAN